MIRTGQDCSCLGDYPASVIVTRPENRSAAAHEGVAHHFGRYLDTVCLIESIEDIVARG